MTRVASISSSALKKLRGELVNPEMVVLPKEEIERIKVRSLKKFKLNVGKFKDYGQSRVATSKGRK